MIKSSDTDIYLTSRNFYWYRRDEQSNLWDYNNCYCFTPEWFTNAKFVRPEFECVSSKQYELIFGKSHSVTYVNDKFTFNDIPDNDKKLLDEIINDSNAFFEKVNKGEVKPLKQLSFKLDELSLLYAEELNNKIIAINDFRFLSPMENLLINLIDCCSSDDDKIELYFNPDNEIVYLAWRWTDECTKENGINWVGGIKPCILKNTIEKTINLLENDLNLLKNNKFYNFENKRYKEV